MITDDGLRTILGGDIPVEPSTAQRLEEAYDHIRRTRRKEPTMKKIITGDRRFWLVIAAAAAMILCAGSVLGYTLTHYDFVNAVWRDGDTEQETASVEEYIHNSGQTLELCGYTFTVEEYMLDENGMGFVRWSMTNPDGLPVMNDATNGGQYNGGDSEGWFEPDAKGMIVTGAGFFLDTEKAIPANNHTWIDGVMSTDSKYWFTDVFKVGS